ncbi:MAG: T9SS type A sorting domain-containing protein [Bacteroidota bacterium]|nr:T9SS type A sorting domain-containing protein [Bacteroidota bacterium]
MHRRLLLSVSVCFLVVPLLAQETPILMRSERGENGPAATVPLIEPIPLPSRVPSPRIVRPGVSEFRFEIPTDVVASLGDSEILFEGEDVAFRVDPAARSITRLTPERPLSAEALRALEAAPSWLENDLRLKFILLAAKRLDAVFAQIILDAEERLRDEVAFVVAHASMQTLTDSRFAQDRAMITRNAETIYRYADSLRYVRLVERGSVAARDWYTTAEYRIYDPTFRDTVWSEIPRELYYWYVVHPKLDQEGVYVRDNFNDNSGQRTYGYAWRDFIWNNPDPAHDYTKVNITTTKGTVDVIPRFGELMQTPTYLWDRRKTYYPFNRPFQPGQSALDVLGNWASRAVPIDVVLPRAFQPNQVLVKHNGMCNEDAFLVAGACRTALIPLVYAGCYAEDHVFGMFWDQDWNHYEFFRGGLAPSGNQYYGITNLLDRGSYGWKISMVEATRPDGYPMNFTRYYTNTCDVELHVVDSLGNPIEGAMVQIYAPAGNGYLVCHRMYTGADGTLRFEAGEQKRYLVNVSHPLLGWSPADSTRAYYLTQNNTVAGAKYTVTVPYPNARYGRETPPVLPPAGIPGGAIRAVITAQDIRSGVNIHDGQRSRFYERDSSGGGMTALMLMAEDQYASYRAGSPYTCFAHVGTVNGPWSMNIPTDRPYIIVVRNEARANLAVDLDITVELLEGTVSAVGRPLPRTVELSARPNPFRDHVTVEIPAGETAHIRLCNALGVTLYEAAAGGETRIDTATLPHGVYFLVVDAGDVRVCRTIVKAPIAQ